jgi:FkbM family methyltransferase
MQFMEVHAYRNRRIAKNNRDQFLWRTPQAQTLVRAAARRGYLPSSIWTRLHPHGLWDLPTPDGGTFWYDSTFRHDGLAPYIVWTDMQDWEATTQPVIFNLSRSAKVFVDVGAYSGHIYLARFAWRSDAARSRLRAKPIKLPQLRANIAANVLQDWVTIAGKALCAATGMAKLSIPSDDSAASLVEGKPGDRLVGVPVATGDQVLARLSIDLIKIDV